MITPEQFRGAFLYPRFSWYRSPSPPSSRDMDRPPVGIWFQCLQLLIVEKDRAARAHRSFPEKGGLRFCKAGLSLISSALCEEDAVRMGGVKREG